MYMNKGRADSLYVDRYKEYKSTLNRIINEAKISFYGTQISNAGTSSRQL